MPLVAAAAISAAGAIGGSALASHSANKAAKTSANAADQALQWEKSQYFDEQNRLAPYRDMGSQAYAKVGKMLGIEPSANPSAQVPYPNVGQRPGPVQATAQPRLVQMQAPTGDVSYVRPELVQMAIQKGARVIPQSWRFSDMRQES
jgi:hypothetical protein